jgi:hypothetical protein
MNTMLIIAQERVRCCKYIGQGYQSDQSVTVGNW